MQVRMVQLLKSVEEGHLRRQPSKTSKDTWQTIKALYSASQGQYEALITSLQSTKDSEWIITLERTNIRKWTSLYERTNNWEWILYHVSTNQKEWINSIRKYRIRRMNHAS